MVEEDIKRAIGRVVRLLDPYFFNRYQNIGLKADRSMFIDGVPALLFIRADKDGDGDYDPLTSTAWDGDSFSAGSGTINWNTVFGVPAAAKAVNCYVIIRDSGALGQNISFKAKSTTTNLSKAARTVVGGDVVHTFDLTLPIAADGTTYYTIEASGADTLDIWIRVMGWYI